MDKRTTIAAVAALIIVALGFAWYFIAPMLDTGLKASGTIEATEVVVSSKVMGRVVKLNIDEGSKVAKGDVLATLDPVDEKAALANARARYNEALSNFKRSERLFSDTIISAQQFDAAKANMEAAKAAYDQAKAGMDNTDITAPISGVVLVKAVEIGELATVGRPIATLADLDEVKLVVYIGEQDVGKISLNARVAVMADAYPGEKFTGRISHISDKAEFTPKAIQTRDERTSLVFGVKIMIPNTDGRLKPGMPADAAF